MGKAAMSTAVQPASIPFNPTQSQLAMAYSVCRGIARSAAKNFYYAFLVLPRPKAEALSAVYAFMRRCDDIADDAATPLHQRRQKLGAWLEAFHRVVSGSPTDDPVLLALADAQRRYNIPAALLDQLAHGTEKDVDDDDQLLCEASAPVLTARYRTFDDLREYCYGVASVVGLVCIRIFGYRDPAAEPLAERCGLAFQLTNIIRDVKEDAHMGRVYLPEEDLEKCGVALADLKSPSDPAKLRRLLQLEADRAREFYRAADQLVPLVDEDSQPALWVLVTIYQRLLDKIAQRDYDVFSSKVSLPVTTKVSILARGFAKRLW
jgi:15-cis-phytoene synthase